MVFSSLQFIFIFMPIFFGCYYAVPYRFKNAVLLAGSLCFYIVGSINHPEHIILLIVSMLADFEVGLLIEKHEKRKKLFLSLGIIFHLLCLCLFKYWNFIAGEIGSIGCVDLTLNIALPVGISFYTFQGISYIADVYKGSIKAEKSLVRYAVYISMFEQLIAGPIVKYSQVKQELRWRNITVKSALKGLGIFVFGLGLKVLLANPLGKLWSQTCAIGFESISTPLAWMAIFAYSFQIYFDFFGYSLMAFGLGKMMGFKLPKNFDHPYTSLTMTEFWRRWHITLGSWFKEYVYIPLGGNRNGSIATIRNLLVVWLLTGIWHGAGYNFVLWGLVLFVILVTEKFLTGKFFNRYPIAGHVYMIILIPLTWAIFAIDDLGNLGVFFSRLFPFFGEGVWSVFKYDFLKYLKLYFPFLIAGVLFSTKIPYRILKKLKSPAIKGIILAVIFAGSVYCMYRGFDDPFLYFRF
ncbi:MAG: MBOAT family protein [Eubacteriales bacterium]|nr:MBOAT family protein [Eubacteriales bacterium]